MARVLWKIGFGIAFLQFGALEIGVVAWMIWHRHVTINGISFLILNFAALQGLRHGYRIIVLNDK